MTGLPQLGCVPRARDQVSDLRQSQLLQHGHLIPLFPPLNNFSVNDAIQNQPTDLDTTSRRWDGPESATVRAFGDPPCGHLIARYDLILDSDAQVWKSSEQATDHFLESAQAEVCFRAAIDVDHAIGRERTVSRRNIPAVKAFDPRAFVPSNFHSRSSLSEE
jgi:hypothetical protein